MRIVLTRHGETDWNAQSRMQGHSPTPINDRGREQACAVGDALAHIGVTKIVSSDLLRAVQTAKIISERLGLSFEQDARLREFCFGSIEGLEEKEIIARDDEMKRAYEADDFTSFGGESAEQVRARMHALLHELEEKYFSETILLVGHGLYFFSLQKHFDILISDEDDIRGIKRGEYQVIDFQNNKAQHVDFWSLKNDVK